jgi:chorismate dehydratase
MDSARAKTADQLRVGAVSYLNTKPLVYRLGELAPEIDLRLDLPSRLADDLSSGQLDVALIPSIEYLADPTYTVVSDACIGCCGPVLSVKLLSRRPMHEIRSLALDAGSRTSSVLARVLLYERYGLSPRLESLAVGTDVADCTADAVLLIGDRAIHLPSDTYVECWDLGDQWYRWSGLPFVFALWVARAGTDLAGLDRALGEARDAGVTHIEEIAREEAVGVGLSVERTITYLRDNLRFHFGAPEKQGLDLYYQFAARLGMAPAEANMHFDDCKAS